jgi:hypothetical protein
MLLLFDNLGDAVTLDDLGESAVPLSEARLVLLFRVGAGDGEPLANRSILMELAERRKGVFCLLMTGEDPFRAAEGDCKRPFAGDDGGNGIVLGDALSLLLLPVVVDGGITDKECRLEALGAPKILSCFSIVVNQTK